MPVRAHLLILLAIAACAEELPVLRIRHLDPALPDVELPVEPAGCRGVAWSADGAHLWTLEGDHRLRSRSADGTELVVVPHVLAQHLVMTGAGPLVVGGIERRQAAALYAPDGTRRWRLTLRMRQVDAIALSPDGTRLAIGGAEGGIAIVDVAGGRLSETIAAHDGMVRALAWSADGGRLLSVCADRPTWVEHMRMPPDQRDRTGARDWTIHAWDAPDGVREVTRQAHGKQHPLWAGATADGFRLRLGDQESRIDTAGQAAVGVAAVGLPLLAGPRGLLLCNDRADWVVQDAAAAAVARLPMTGRWHQGRAFFQPTLAWRPDGAAFAEVWTCQGSN